MTPIIYLNDLKMFKRVLFSVILANAPKEKYTIHIKKNIPIIDVIVRFINKFFINLMILCNS
jgi:hypothetical protein